MPAVQGMWWSLMTWEWSNIWPTMPIRDFATAEEVVQDSFIARHCRWRRLRDSEKTLSNLARRFGEAAGEPPGRRPRGGDTARMQDALRAHGFEP
jgi:hypothetical protein